ncbi:hypothetical protein [Leptolyngbya ohadii]|uniref:hypothetical protein n=1 Tax=Leptolyngbya ohadii TaxID=1962290 RepID=UPI00117B697A|nr:hypothetical protein [Leptolyngbya ohadii]
MTERRIRRLPQCEHCRNNARSFYSLCAIHPYGVAEDLKRCPGYKLDPNYLESDGWWEPQEFGTYNGDLIASPVERLTKSQQLELLLWHPLFTGMCPQCRHPFASDYDCNTPRRDAQRQVDRTYWDCSKCGWTDGSV